MELEIEAGQRALLLRAVGMLLHAQGSLAEGMALFVAADETGLAVQADQLMSSIEAFMVRAKAQLTERGY